jgi:hypothetical protein
MKCALLISALYCSMLQQLYMSMFFALLNQVYQHVTADTLLLLRLLLLLLLLCHH